jgi:hypothetical protein
VIGTIDEYWARGDWIGEVNDKEITQRIRSRQWARRDARRDARWMAVRDELHREYKAGNFQCDNWPGRWQPNEADFKDDAAPYWFYRMTRREWIATTKSRSEWVATFHHQRRGD